MLILHLSEAELIIISIRHFSLSIVLKFIDWNYTINKNDNKNTAK